MSLLLALLVGGVLLAGGWFANRIVNAPVSGPLRLTGHFQGIVETVDANGSAVCIRPDHASARCSVPFLRTGTPKLAVGDDVEVTVASLRLDDGSAQEIFIIDRPEPGY